MNTGHVLRNSAKTTLGERIFCIPFNSIQLAAFFINQIFFPPLTILPAQFPIPISHKQTHQALGLVRFCVVFSSTEAFLVTTFWLELQKSWKFLLPPLLILGYNTFCPACPNSIYKMIQWFAGYPEIWSLFLLCNYLNSSASVLPRSV